MASRTNSARAAEARQVCDFFESLTGTDELEDQVSDILAHLMHLCRLETLDFEDALRRARMNFEAEVEEDPDH